EMQLSNIEKHEGLSITDWDDERGRLRMWAANIGAHHTGQSSLDFRLRDSTQIQEQVIRLLENLARQLEDAGTVLTEGEDSDVDSINGSDSGNEESQSEFQQLRSNYRERHAAKLRQGIDHDVERAGRSETLSETIATNIKNRGFDDVVDDNASDSGSTQTSYASTLISGSGITMPAAPKASRGVAPFECHYCYCIVTAPNSRSWIRHVFKDLEPYVCTDMDCKTPNRLYTTRYEWLHHLKTAHPHHENKSHKCALCGDHQRDQASLGRHVARHLQELALFILPRNEADSDEDLSDGKADTSSNRSSLDNGNELPSAIASNDPTCDAIAVEDSGYRTVNEAKGEDTAASATSPVVGGTKKIRHHSQTGEEDEENESEDDEVESVKDTEDPEEGDTIPLEATSKDYLAEEDSTNATSQVTCPGRGERRL
ncbi:MAG: hypothetical protein Q9198_005496, partial [Flavoplaca austrocitrina]